VFGISLKARHSGGDTPAGVNGHAPQFAQSDDGERTFNVVHWRPGKGGRAGQGDKLAGGLLTGASLLVVAALIGAGIVGYEAQRLFALAHNHTAPDATAADHLRAVIIAAIPDVGWVAMALVALVAALRGQSSLRARVGVVMFFALSLGAQVLYAPRTVEGLLVAVIAPVAMAWMLETLIVEVRRWAANRRGLEISETPILTGALLAAVRLVRLLLGILMWLVRLGFSPGSTFGGLREWVLDTAPIAPGRSLASMRAAEAAAHAETAHATVERVRQEAKEERQALEARVADERQKAEDRLRRIEQEAADRIAAAEQAATEQADTARREAAEEVARVRAEAEARLRRLTETSATDAGKAADQIAGLQGELAEVRGQLDRARGAELRVQQAEQTARSLRGQLTGLQATMQTLQRYAGARAVLRTRYEMLRAAGDPRYGDANAVRQLAEEWAPDAGVTEETARRYLTQHIANPYASQEQE